MLQAGRHRYTVAAARSTCAASGKGDSLLASIEVGQAFALGASGWKIEPQLQLVHQRLSLDDVAHLRRAGAAATADDGWIVRAGVRVKGEIATGAGMLQPYGRVNVYQANGGSDVTRFIGPAACTDIAQRARRQHGRVGRGRHAAP